MGKREFKNDERKTTVTRQLLEALSCDYCGLESRCRDKREALWWMRYRQTHHNKKYACPDCARAIAVLRSAMLKVEVH